jgi:oligopeptide transport system permease protein
MKSFFFKRFLMGIPVLWVVATLTFIIMHVVPGGPFDREKKLPQEIIANIESKYHLDKPIFEQYGIYMKNLLKGDMGPSYKYIGRDVKDIIKDSFPVSFQLGVIALLITVIIGIPFGILAGMKQNSWIDKVCIFLATAGISLPNFVIGALLILVFSNYFSLLPPALWEGWKNMIMPGITLGAGYGAYIARLTRSSVIEVLSKDYIKAARAKGLNEKNIIFKHILKNALPPIITVYGPLAASLVTGSFVVEYIYSVPGMGRFFITAVTNRDYPLIMGVTLVYSLLIVLANIIVDFIYALLDPRVSVE